MNRGAVHLPVAPDPARPQPVFPEGSRVRLRSCPCGEPGVVRRMLRGRVEVRWPQFKFVGRYRADRLVLVEMVSDQEGITSASGALELKS